MAWRLSAIVLQSGHTWGSASAAGYLAGLLNYRNRLTLSVVQVMRVQVMRVPVMRLG
jgi:hypothetical protein